MESCYFPNCDQNVVGREHTPAKCFFPKGYRFDLTTVPSCDEHNAKFSKDDEYLRNLIVMEAGVNRVARNHYFKTAVNSFINSPKLFESTTGIRREAFVGKQKTYEILVDFPRIYRTLAKIAFGLYRDYFCHNWVKEIFILVPSLNYTMVDGTPVANLPIPEFEFQQKIGKNPEVFYFSISKGGRALKMNFYEGFEVYAINMRDD